MNTEVMKGFRTIIVNLLVIAFAAARRKYPWVPLPDDASIDLIALALANIGLRLITNTPVGKKETEAPPIIGSAGWTRQAVMASISIIIFALLLAGATLGLSGCANNKTATQQISEQTSNPYHLAQAVYLDALVAYNETLKTYLPYKEVVEKSRPATAERIRSEFAVADGMLADFKEMAQLGKYQDMDAATFRAVIRDISIEIAMQIDKGGK